MAGLSESAGLQRKEALLPVEAAGVAHQASVPATTRWQGIRISSGLRLQARPTARAAFGAPMASAIWP